MAKYFEIYDNNGTITLDDTNAFLHVKRKGTLESICTYESTQEFINIAGYRMSMLQIKAKYRRIYSYTFAAGEYNLAFAPQLNNENFSMSCIRVSSNQVKVVVNCFFSSTEADWQSYIDNIMVYVIANTRGETSHLGLELYDEQGKIIYQLTDKMVNIVAPYTIDVHGANISREGLPWYFSAGYSLSGRAVIFNSSILGIWVPASGGLPYEYNLGITSVSGWLCMHSSLYMGDGIESRLFDYTKTICDFLIIDVSKV